MKWSKLYWIIFAVSPCWCMAQLQDRIQNQIGLDWRQENNEYSEYQCASGCAELRDLYSGLKAEPEVERRLDELEEQAKLLIEKTFQLDSDTFLTMTGIMYELSQQRISTDQISIKKNIGGVQIRPTFEFLFAENSLNLRFDLYYQF